MALTAARTAADTAADAAATAAYSAQAAVQAVMDIAGSDEASYDTAEAKADAAHAAATAAREASDAAGRATTSADAAMHQATAEAKQTEAETALADAMSYAGMVTQAKADADVEAERLAAEALADQMLADAKQAAMDAATAAMTASNEASAAVEEQRANKDRNTITAAAFARAEDAAVDAAAAAGDAAVANNAAQAATTQEDVDMYGEQAEDAKRAAELAQANAMSFAGLVGNVVQMMADATDEADMLAAAQLAAMMAAEAAREAADEAETAAIAAEEAAPGSSAATKAREAADAAEVAAALAEAENLKAEAATDSSTALAAQLEAEAQKNVAEGGRTTALANRDTAQDSRLAAEQVQEERDLANAKADAEDLYDDATDGVLFHYNAVVGKAGDAMTQASNARASANRAARARTDATAANKYATAAGTASANAQAARARAVTAKANAETARQAAMDATMSDDAEAALADLETANDALTAEHTGAMGAGLAYMAARDAAKEAAKAQGEHVISLLIHANAQDLDLGDPSDVDLAAALAKARDERHEAVAGAINSATGMHAAEDGQLGDRDQNSSTNGTTESSSTALASWLGNALDDEDTADVDESTMPTLSITVTTTSGTDLTFRTKAAEDDPGTAGVDESMTMPKTATALDRGLGNFTNGYQIEEGGTRAIVFTDKVKGADEVAEVDAVTSRYVEDQVVNAPAGYSLGTDKTGPTFTGVTWTPTDEEPLTGTLACSETTCDIELNADGTISEIMGYEFTGSRDAVAAVTAAPAMEDLDYLAFGVWLMEDGDDGTEGNQPSFAAFANGGETIADFDDYVTLTGTATYRGNATASTPRVAAPITSRALPR